MTGVLDKLNVNIIGVFIAAAVNQFISAMWFGPLFGRIWKKYSRWNPEELKKMVGTTHTRSIWGSFIEQMISGFVLAVLIHNLHITSTTGAVALGVLVWLGFMATTNVNEVLWHGEKFNFYLLNQANYLVRNITTAIIYSRIAL